MSFLTNELSSNKSTLNLTNYDKQDIDKYLNQYKNTLVIFIFK